MANFENNFNAEDFSLISEGSISGSIFGNNPTDYARLSVYNGSQNQNFNLNIPIHIFYSKLDNTGDTEVSINIQGSGPLSDLSDKFISTETKDFHLYTNNSQLYIKPNEILSSSLVPEGTYTLRLELLRQHRANSQFVNDRLIIKQISPSRKEVRLKLTDTKLGNPGNGQDWIDDFENSIIDSDLQKYNYDHVLYVGNGVNIPITNYLFDKISNGDKNQSLILRLYEPLPQFVNIRQAVTIEKEIGITQNQEIFYFSELGERSFGEGLAIDSEETWINPDTEDLTFNNYNDLTGSLSTEVIQSFFSGSSYEYPNLKVDYREFSNHTFFGSAKRKLENFKTKVETIQGYYSDISKSLAPPSGSSLDGDLQSLVKYRKNLFNKIQDEYDTLTPYERFLYYDGQSDSTASAPGIGKNLAHSEPMSNIGNALLGSLSNYDGFDNVYHHGNKKRRTSQYNNLFTEKYMAHEKPFFNYSGSVYLSFLMKGHHSINTGSTWHWENRNPVSNTSLGVSLPKDAMHKTTLLEPTLTGSKYQRFIYKASQSYWAPTSVVDYDTGNISDFTAGSTQVEVLSGNTKTGSNPITTEGAYQYLGTYTSPSGSTSGVPFTGSIMPAGELFRIYYRTNLSASLIGYYDYQGVTIDDNDFEVFDKSGNDNTLEFRGTGGSSAFTSASIVTGVSLGGDGIALAFTGSEGSAQSGSMFITTQGSTAPIESAPISMSTDSENSVNGFTMATWYQTTSSKSNTTIMSIDIKSGSTDVHGWNIQRLGNSIAGEVTREGVNILDADTSADGLKTGTISNLKDGNFHHIALTYDNLNGTGSMYFDGNLIKQGNARGLITGSNQIYRLVVGSGTGGAQGYDDAGFDETRFYTRALNSDEIRQLYLTVDGMTNTYTTDVKVTLEDPTDVLPFDILYQTSSTAWTNWYDTMYTASENFDTDNIHSLENNLPTYIKDSSEYNDLKDFLSLQGEHFDLIRNHIDTFETLHKRGYKRRDSVPDNSLPILIDNMGWESIQPFSSSLADYFGQHLSSLTTVDKLSNANYRKTLNNLVYLYKTKGTRNAVRALLNVYGYPPDVIQISEFGGSNEPQNDFPITTTASLGTTINDTDLGRAPGNVSFTLRKQALHNYRFNKDKDRILNLNWGYNSADINTIEFVYKHKKTTNTQEILKSSGSAAEHLWDLILIPSTDGISSSFEFRLNNSQNGENAIGSRGYSMSLDYNKMYDGELWNVMVQRMTSSISGTGTQEYRLYAGLQEEDRIKTLSYTTMSISGGAAGGGTPDGLGFYANQNWTGTGSRALADTKNLTVGGTLSSSLSEIRAWSTPLSASKFRLHTLNKFSTVGNTINSDKEELVYHFKLNENYSSSSLSSSAQTTLAIVDSAPKKTLTTDYTFTISSSLATSSILFGKDTIDSLGIGLQDALQNIENNNKIIINPKNRLIGNLNPKKSSTTPLNDKTQGRQKRSNSSNLEINRSPQDFVNNFILDKIQGQNLETKYGNPSDLYSSSYAELDSFRDEFFDNYPVKVDTNKFIRGHEDVLSHALEQAIKKIAPARSSLSDPKLSGVGVTIKPTILEKQRYERKEHDVETNPNTAVGETALATNTTGELNTAVGKDALYANTTGNSNVAIGNTALISNTEGSNNTAVGRYALDANTTASHNTAVGYSALSASVTAGNNACFGYQAGKFTTTGDSITGIGSAALQSNTTGDNNTAVGESALQNNTTADNNTAVGKRAMETNTTGINNTAVGSYALFANTTAEANTGIGYYALAAATTGNNNTAVGDHAADSLTTATDIIAIGQKALDDLTTGNGNIAIGRYALADLTDGSSNVAIGAYDGTAQPALRVSTGSANVAIGSGALAANTTASNNTAVGHEALNDNTTGNHLVAVGNGALDANTTGSSSTAIGAHALGGNTDGHSNTAVGYSALVANTEGDYNVAVGRDSLQANTTGNNNVAVGKSALYSNTTAHGNSAFGHDSLLANTTGTHNTAVGTSALTANTTGIKNTAIGNSVLVANTTGSANTAIGWNSLATATTAADNTAVGYNSLAAATTCTGNVAIGNQAMASQTTGINQVAIGEHALDACTTASYNTAIGYDALTSTVTGADNTAVGGFALADNTAGYNTAVGYYALKANTSGDHNVSVGYTALDANTTGSENTAIGSGALSANTTASDSTAVGYYALHLNTTGVANSAFGRDALKNNTTGQYNNAFGYQALESCTTGQANNAFGLNAMYGISTGSYNSAFGHAALTNITTGTHNTAIGHEALDALTTGETNTAVGSNAGTAITSGHYNTCMGYDSLKACTTGERNTAIGREALKDATASYLTAVGMDAAKAKTSGDYTDAFGYRALQTVTTGVRNAAFGNHALSAVTTGSYNQACGMDAGNNVTTGDYNTFIGYDAGDITTGDNNTCVGNGSVASSATVDNEITLGNGSIQTLRCNASLSSTSDRRDKTDIVDLPVGLNFLNSLRPVKFKWQRRVPDSTDGKVRAGFIAQELQEAQINDNYLDLVMDSNPDQLEVRQGNLIPVLVQAIKELSAKVTALEGN